MYIKAPPPLPYCSTSLLLVESYIAVQNKVIKRRSNDVSALHNHRSMQCECLMCYKLLSALYITDGVIQQFRPKLILYISHTHCDRTKRYQFYRE